MNIEKFFESLSEPEKIKLVRLAGDYKSRIDDVNIASSILEEGIDEITPIIDHIGVMDINESHIVSHIKK